jgi:hypothetical protein
MTSPLDGTLGSLVGRLDLLRIECRECGRFDRYSVAGLIGVTAQAIGRLTG